MNQAIQILDGATYVARLECLKIEGFYQGQLITCYIAGGDEKTLLAFYSDHQFDIEERLESLIEQQTFDEDGSIKLNVEQII
ncbi:DUF1488 family protein [Paraglaciecola sp. 25GB23A]|uniref:DUF1488 family protein n=1 Tax=Paraglaciecola sp. 25GB23A TaxID=3156068 RepID=UPI0032AFE195